MLHRTSTGAWLLTVILLIPHCASRPAKRTAFPERGASTAVEAARGYSISLDNVLISRCNGIHVTGTFTNEGTTAIRISRHGALSALTRMEYLLDNSRRSVLIRSPYVTGMTPSIYELDNVELLPGEPFTISTPVSAFDLQSEVADLARASSGVLALNAITQQAMIFDGSRIPVGEIAWHGRILVSDCKPR